MASSIGWLDHDREDADRARRLISLFSRAEARDELGLGTIRDAFSDLLLPGTSTIQTRLRYFILIPRIMGEISPRLPKAPDREAALRRREADLIDQLGEARDKRGLIGADAGKDLKRMPSAVYWHGLGRWGIRLAPNDGVALTLDKMAAGTDCWSPVPDDGALDGFVMTPAERDFVIEQLEGLKVAGTAPAISWLFSNAHRFIKALGGRGALLNAGLEEALSAMQGSGAPATLVEDVRCAALLAQVMHGAALLYNEMLAGHFDDGEKAREYSAWLDSWRRELPRQPLDPGVLLAPVRRTLEGRPLNPHTLAFVEGWFALAWKAPRGAEAKALVKAREQATKPARARLSKPAGKGEWSGASGASRLDFRWATTRQYLLDLTGPAR